jgi:hypothetical protein
MSNLDPQFGRWSSYLLQCLKDILAVGHEATSYHMILPCHFSLLHFCSKYRFKTLEPHLTFSFLVLHRFEHLIKHSPFM